MTALWHMVLHGGAAAILLAIGIPFLVLSARASQWRPRHIWVRPPRDVRPPRESHVPRRETALQDDGPDDGWNGPLPGFLSAKLTD